MRAYHPMIVTSNVATVISSSVVDNCSVGKSIHADLAKGPLPDMMMLIGSNNNTHLPQPSSQLKAIEVDAIPNNKKKQQRPKDPRRDTSISFEEMRRLMRVYGPVKVLRKRGTNNNGTDQSSCVKPDSIRRKFYRWFPDFNQRFVKTPEGWYAPRAGHQHEMDYREAMRKMDQEVLVRKRSATKRYNTKARKGSV